MFNYYQPTKIHFGVKRLNDLGDICLKYGQRCFLVTTCDAPLQPLYTRVKKLLHEKGIKVVHFDQVEPNPCYEMIENAFQLLKQNPCDFVLAVGGGSSIDTAKVIAFTNQDERIDWNHLFNQYDSPFVDYPSRGNVLPLISVPTTSGTGSQVTQASVISIKNEKITFYHHDLFSKECILDPELMLTLPHRITASTGFDAFTHAFESYISPHASAYSEMDSLQAMEYIITYLPQVLADPQNVELRAKMSLADTLAGRALANSGANAPHPLSEIIGGIAHIPHGEALAIVFPAFIHYAKANYPEKMLKVAKLFNPQATDLEIELIQFLKTIQLDKKLKDAQVDEQMFQQIISSPILDHLPFGNREFLEQILKDSYE